MQSSTSSDEETPCIPVRQNGRRNVTIRGGHVGVQGAQGRRTNNPPAAREIRTHRGKTVPSNKIWSDEIRDNPQEFLFTGTPGIKIFPDDRESCLASVKLFLTNELVSKFVQYTNDYAQALIQNPQIQARVLNKERSVYKQWTDTNLDEMWMYITITIMMGIVKKPEFDMFWTNDLMFQTPIFSRLMSRTRFLYLRSMVHFSDVINFDNLDPLKKLRNMLDVMQERFKQVYVPERNLCVDEYLSLWKIRLSFRVYLPSKRERYGLKIFMGYVKAPPMTIFDRVVSQ